MPGSPRCLLPVVNDLRHCGITDPTQILIDLSIVHVLALQSTAGVTRRDIEKFGEAAVLFAAVHLFILTGDLLWPWEQVLAYRLLGDVGLALLAHIVVEGAGLQRVSVCNIVVRWDRH